MLTEVVRQPLQLKSKLPLLLKFKVIPALPAKAISRHAVRRPPSLMSCPADILRSEIYNDTFTDLWSIYNELKKRTRSVTFIALEPQSG